MPLSAAVNPVLRDVTERVIDRSRASRADYVARCEAAAAEGPRRGGVDCSNLAHSFAACSANEKAVLGDENRANIAIVSAYNDMLSAHQPLERFPAIIKAAALESGAVAQFAGGVPAMCDGVTQGRAGMELSLFSRDVIAMATAIALSHDVFDAALLLGVCDKIVPGLVIGALSFGHLPMIFVPAGPMVSGLSNPEKARIRQAYAAGEVGRKELLEAESKSYHGPGTCTFYGTANSNQMLMELMGLHLPGSAFVNPNTPLRDALVAESARRVAAMAQNGPEPTPLWRVVDERSVINGIVGLMATGGSTNHTIHLIAMARAAGVRLTWDDFGDLSAVVPLLAKVYPNGVADVNHFQAAGGVGLVIRELLRGGLLHPDVTTVAGAGGIARYTQEPALVEGKLVWRDGPSESLDPAIVGSLEKPFAPEGGLRILRGNLGRGVIKISAVKPEHRLVEAPAIVFKDQEEVIAAFKRGELDRDFVAVLIGQGPRANGMPELHKLTPTLGLLQDRGRKVALVTDGRMSGASGKVPAAIHVTPEAMAGGPLARVRDGDIIRLDAERGTLAALVDEAAFAARVPTILDLRGNQFGTGRDLFTNFRRVASGAEDGASVFADAWE